MKRDRDSVREQSISPQLMQMGRGQTHHLVGCNENWFLDKCVPVMVTAHKYVINLRRAVTSCYSWWKVRLGSCCSGLQSRWEREGRLSAEVSGL